MVSDSRTSEYHYEFTRPSQFDKLLVETASFLVIRLGDSYVALPQRGFVAFSRKKRPGRNRP